jgi:hypothetical protein
LPKASLGMSEERAWGKLGLQRPAFPPSRQGKYHFNKEHLSRPKLENSFVAKAGRRQHDFVTSMDDGNEETRKLNFRSAVFVLRREEGILPTEAFDEIRSRNPFMRSQGRLNPFPGIAHDAITPPNIKGHRLFGYSYYPAPSLGSNNPITARLNTRTNAWNRELVSEARFCLSVGISRR